MNGDIKAPSSGRMGLMWGLYVGIALGISAMLRLTLRSVETTFVDSIVGFVLTALGISLALYIYRKGVVGAFTYGQGLKLGMLVSVVAAAVHGVILYIGLKFIVPDAMEMLKRIVAESIAKKVDPSMVESVMNSPFTKIWFNPSVLSISTMFNTFLLGLFVSLIIAGILKRADASGADRRATLS